MRTALLASTIGLALSVASAQAQKPVAGIKLSDVAGTWTVESMVKTAAGKDTAVTSELVATADEKGWVTKLTGRDPIPTRIAAMGGDSVVAEAGPFQSVVRAGQMVTTHETMHFKGDTMTGTIEARYANGDVVKGTIKGTRKK